LALSRATGSGLALRLNIEQAPELENLPWECLYDPEEEAFIAASAETPFARCPAEREAGRTAPSDLPLRLLTAVAAPRDCERFGLPAVNAEKELESARAMLRPALDAKLLKLETIAHASPSQVRQAILRFHPHIFHLVAHGASRRNLGHALLEDEAGRGRLANARVLLAFLLDDEETRLVLLSPPEQATGRSLEALVGLAGQLHQSHSKAIMTLRLEMDVRSRQRLWREFYRALLPWNAVDVALAESRRQMLAEQGEGGPWSAPLLFLPASSGQLFHAKGADKR
jgi:CHAT domain-containing protein